MRNDGGRELSERVASNIHGVNNGEGQSVAEVVGIESKGYE